jgi:hypothetical protein
MVSTHSALGLHEANWCILHGNLAVQRSQLMVIKVQLLDLDLTLIR